MSGMHAHHYLNVALGPLDFESPRLIEGVCQLFPLWEKADTLGTISDTIEKHTDRVFS
jgi:hypothetical protein